MNEPPAPGDVPRAAPTNEDANARYFDAWRDYQQLVGSLDTYDRTTRALAGELRGRVVDVGSGGVVNYDGAGITELVLVDISTEYLAHVTLPPGAIPKTGTAVGLPLGDGTFDSLLMQMLVHHLAESDFQTTRTRVRQAFREAYRVLAPGGKIVVLESVVNRGFELAERISFPLTRRVLRLIGHPLVFQWTASRLAAFAREAGFTALHSTRIPRGRWMIFLGRRWPTLLVPVSLYKIVATKPV
jgi:SAM-dependent methyltransferase